MNVITGEQRRSGTESSSGVHGDTKVQAHSLTSRAVARATTPEIVSSGMKLLDGHGEEQLECVAAGLSPSQAEVLSLRARCPGRLRITAK